MTQYGRIEDLRVPKLRKGNGALEWQTIRRYERCWGPFLDQQVMNYCLGLSLRDLQESIYTTLGEVLSVASCNRIVASVGQRIVCQQVNDAVVGTTQHVIEQALEAELSAYVGAERYEHLPWGRDAAQTRSGFYRHAACYVCGDFRLSGKSSNAVARLRAQGSRVVLKPVHGSAIYRRTVDDDWELLQEGESAARFGDVYRNDDSSLYFEIRNG